MNSELTLQLVDNHRQFLAFLERRVGDRALAEDILQDAFVKSLEKGEDVRDEASSVAWFYRTLRNAVIDHYRRTGARHRALESFARELGDAVEPPPEMYDAICGCVSRLATTLKPEYAAAIQRIDVEGAPVQDFAAEAGITPNNAAVRVFRAREALRKQVRTSCGTCAEHGCLECSCGATAKAAAPHAHH
ncbi:MAG TPA: sigma-70 family RNA polymerase sigma factor [Thermoanaerobaculia bacterium]|nr:sigma-70 family RNA polymerase sigma factor [Thermoanaerobaculia bacterium]